jgi:hypothetical protein
VRVPGARAPCDHRGVLARALLLAASLLAVAGFAVGAHQWRQEAAGERLIRGVGPIAPADAVRADRHLRRAARLNPDRNPDIARAIVLLERRRPAPAIAILRAITRDEPRNIEAWAWLQNAARDARDPALVRIAGTRIRGLRPPLD